MGKKRDVEGKGKGKAPAVEEKEEEEEEEEEYNVTSSEGDDDTGSDEYSDAESDPNEEDQDGAAGEEVDVDFDFFDPREADFHGLKTLLQNYLDGQPFDCSSLVDGIIQQSTVGTVVRTSEDEAPVGLVSVINTHAHRGRSDVKQLVSFLKNRCADKDVKSKLEKVLATEKLGLIVSERLVNCPPQLAEPLMRALFDEIEWATEDEPTEERRKHFVFDQFLVVTRVCRDAAAAKDKDAQPSSGPSKKQKKGDGTAATEQIVFIRPEDEIFHELCTWSYSWSIEQSFSNDLKPMRMVMLLDAAQVLQVRRRLETHEACQLSDMPEPPMKKKK